MSPVRLRPKPAAPSGTSGRWKALRDRHDSSDDELDPDTPCRPTVPPRQRSRTQLPAAAAAAARSSSSRDSHGATTQNRQYCTQKCLLGLANGGALDPSCPNVRDHGESHHQIKLRTYLALIRHQLAKDRDTDCQPIGIPAGACGVLFQVRLLSHGYTVAAKCTTVDFVRRLEREAVIYHRLRSIQGVHVSVHLGNINLQVPYFFEGIALLVHMMFFSYDEHCIFHHSITSENKFHVFDQVDRSVQAIHDLGVLHRDLMPRNILWSEKTRGSMVIDFERFELIKPRRVLGVISAN